MHSETLLTTLAAATLTDVSCLLHRPAAHRVSCLVSSQPSSLNILANVSDDITPLFDISPWFLISFRETKSWQDLACYLSDFVSYFLPPNLFCSNYTGRIAFQGTAWHTPPKEFYSCCFFYLECSLSDIYKEAPFSFFLFLFFLCVCVCMRKEVYFLQVSAQISPSQ